MGFSRQEYWSELPFPSPVKKKKSILFKICIYLLIWPHQVLVAARRIFVGSWGIFSLGSQALLAEHGLRYPTGHRILVPWPVIELTSPTLQGRFLTIGPPGKSHKYNTNHTGVLRKLKEMAGFKGLTGSHPRETILLMLLFSSRPREYAKAGFQASAK